MIDFKCFSRTNWFTIIHLESAFPVNIALTLLECTTLFGGPLLSFTVIAVTVPSCRLGSKSDDTTCAVKLKFYKSIFEMTCLGSLFWRGEIQVGPP